MRLGSRVMIGLMAVLLGFGAAACGDDDNGTDPVPGGDTGGGGGATTVQVDDNFFEPEEVQISTGDTVTWEWVGNEPHNVVADDFESEIQQSGTFEHTFDEAGSYEYVCTIHPGMEGTVEVAS